MSRLPIIIDDNLTTVMYWMSYRQGWLADAEDIQIAGDVTADDLRQRDVMALIDSVTAAGLLDSHVVLQNHAVASQRESMLTLVTHIRPDQVDEVTVSHPGVSPTGRALGGTVIPEFYGIQIAGWTAEHRDVDESTAVITEGVAALQPGGDPEHYHEDLGRAWFLLADLPFVSHVLVVPRSRLAEDPEAVRAASARLDELRRVSGEHSREVRRNISKDFDLDRETVTAALGDQVFELGETERTGLESLYRRVGALRDIGRLRSSIVSLT